MCGHGGRVVSLVAVIWRKMFFCIKLVTNVPSLPAHALNSVCYMYSIVNVLCISFVLIKLLLAISNFLGKGSG